MRAEVPTSRREQKKAEVREALVVAADALFEEHGFEGTTVDQIAESAGVSRRTFFRYFPSKEAIAFPRAPTRLVAFRQLLRESVAQQAVFPAVRDACTRVAQEMTSVRGEELRRQHFIDRSPTLLAAELEVYKTWEEAIAEACIPEGASPARERQARMFAAATIGIVRSAMREWFDSGCERDILVLAEEAFDLLENGFGGVL